MKRILPRKHRGTTTLAIVLGTLGLLAAWSATVGAQPTGPTQQKQQPGSASTGPERDPPKKDALTTVTYDVRDLVDNRYRATGFGYPGGPYKVQDLMKMIIQTNLEVWSNPDGNHSIQEVNGTRLEIRTSAKYHGEITSLLDSMRRLSDVAVIVNAALYEVDRAYYEKELQPKRANDQLEVIPLGLAQQIHKRGVLVKPLNVEMIPNGEGAKIFSLRHALVYRGKPKDPKNPLDAFATTWYGVSLKSSVSVSADRRSVKLKIAQQVTDLVEVRKKTVPNPFVGGNSEIEVPHIVESSTSATIEVKDGNYLLVPVRYQPPAAKDKDRVLVLLVQPDIYIEAEQKYMREQAARERVKKALQKLRVFVFPLLELYFELQGM